MMIPEDAPASVKIDRQIEEALRAERRADRQGGLMFAKACRAGDVDAMLLAADFIGENTVDGWRHAMRAVGRLPLVSAEIRDAFLRIWIESKHIPLEVGHRPTMSRALHVLMPPVEVAAPMRLFRGTSTLERQRRLYGFSWTTHIDIARRFAEQARAAEDGSVILEALAPADAIHLCREPEDYYDESEVVVDPYRLLRVRVVERLPSTRPKHMATMGNAVRALTGE